MDRQSQNKVIDAGFIIIRKDDYPSPRIKARYTSDSDFRTYEKYESKAERDRSFKRLLKDKNVISD